MNMGKAYDNLHWAENRREGSSHSSNRQQMLLFGLANLLVLYNYTARAQLTVRTCQNDETILSHLHHRPNTPQLAREVAPFELHLLESYCNSVME